MKIISFYLPQFHEIPENNQWWGKGFTEWTNTKKAKPLYWGHYQPRTPYKDNYYDLSEPRVLANQMNMAKRYGVDGFCFYHYWFNGKKLLERPAEMLLNNHEANLPFCFAWANEPWTRTWDGALGSKEILISQTYGDEKEWKAHFDYLLPFFKDERYICIEQKPVFIIYRAKNVPKCKEMLDYWSELAMKNGLLGLCFLQMNTSIGIDKGNRRFYGSIDFEPMRTFGRRYDYLGIKRPLWVRQAKIYDMELLSKFLPSKISYDSLYKDIIKRKKNPRNKTFFGAFVGWDNTPRKNKHGFVIAGATPKKFEKYLEIQVKRSIKAGNEFIFINAWNEWGEGAYLEPDKRYGYAYLNAVKRVSNKCRLFR